MKLNQVIKRTNEYPQELQELAFNAQQKILERIGISIDDLSNNSSCSIQNRLTVATYIGWELFRKFAQIHLLSIIDETDNGQGINYTLDDVYDVLHTLPEEISCQILLRCVSFEKASTIEKLLCSLQENKKDEFINLIGEEKVDTNQLNKLLTHFELCQEQDTNIADIAKNNPNSFADQMSQLFANLIDTSFEKAKREGGDVPDSQNLKEDYKDIILQMINQSFTHEENSSEGNIDCLNNPESTSEESEEIKPVLLIAYQLMVSAFLSHESIFFDAEKDVFLRYVRTPEIAHIYDLIKEIQINKNAEEIEFSLPEDFFNYPIDYTIPELPGFIDSQLRYAPKQFEAIVEILVNYHCIEDSVRARYEFVRAFTRRTPKEYTDIKFTRAKWLGSIDYLIFLIKRFTEGRKNKYRALLDLFELNNRDEEWLRDQIENSITEISRKGVLADGNSFANDIKKAFRTDKEANY